jgi:hypothetical protein
VIKNDKVIMGRNDWLFYYGEGCLDYYLGNNVMSESAMNTYLTAMENLTAICQSQNKQVVFLILPVKSQVYSEFMPSYELTDTYKRDKRLVDYVKANSSVNISYPLDELIAAKAYYQVYKKYDTHWNDAGAFIGTQVIYKMLGKSTTNILNLEVSQTNISGGDLFKLGLIDMTTYPDDVAYIINYKPDIIKVNESGTNNVENSVYRVESNSDNDQKIVVVGDSYRDSMVDFIWKDFKYSSFSHRKMLGDAGLSEDLKNADIIVVESIERYDSNMLKAINSMIDILSN